MKVWRNLDQVSDQLQVQVQVCVASRRTWGLDAVVIRLDNRRQDTEDRLHLHVYGHIRTVWMKPFVLDNVLQPMRSLVIRSSHGHFSLHRDVFRHTSSHTSGAFRCVLSVQVLVVYSRIGVVFKYQWCVYVHHSVQVVCSGAQALSRYQWCI